MRKTDVYEINGIRVMESDSRVGDQVRVVHTIAGLKFLHFKCMCCSQTFHKINDWYEHSYGPKVD